MVNTGRRFLMQRIKYLAIIPMIMGIFMLFSSNTLFAVNDESASPPTSSQSNANAGQATKSAKDCQKSAFFGLTPWYKYLPFDDNCNVVTTDLGGKLLILILIATAELLLNIAGILAVFFVIFGGFKFITSQGEPQQIAGARKTILNAIIGLIIAILSVQLVVIIGSKIGS
jgi:hypothetical protein